MRTLKISLLVLFAIGISYPLYTNNSVYGQPGVTDAPTGFDNASNGFTTQAQMDADRVIFEERETIDDGLGPLYNATACSDCHKNPVTGGSRQITQTTAGHLNVCKLSDHS